jgi:Domain of unknown function (DUF4062)
MKKIYISSTYIDLKEHRAALEHALRKMNYHVCCMEDYVATDERVDARCTQDVMTCDFYVGIIAQRYGWIPPGQEYSITELEYRQARRQPNKTRCLMFVLDPDADWPLPFVDALTNPDAAGKLHAFRANLEGSSVGRFRSVETLVREVMASVYMEDLKGWKIALRREFESILNECKAVPIGAPSDLGAGRNATLDYKALAYSSETPVIIDLLTALIHSSNNAKLVGIDLARAGGWWSTRLHLLAGLLLGYTRVEKIAFSANGRCIGTCGPNEVRQALASSKPAVETAFGQALVKQPELDPAHDVRQIVLRFAEKLEAMGGEEAMRQASPPQLVDITENIARNFPGFNPDVLSCPQEHDAIELLPMIVAKPYPYVPVDFSNGDGVVIDRVRLSTRIAQLAIERI